MKISPLFFIKKMIVSAGLITALAVSHQAWGATVWKPVVPEGYLPITWAKAPGIATFFKAPGGNGAIDFLTRISIAENYIGFIATSSAPADWGAANPVFTGANDPLLGQTMPENSPVIDSPMVEAAVGGYRNFAFARFAAEAAKQKSAARFVWNGPFFNITVTTTDLSLALKSTVGTTTLITSGSRPAFDMAKGRRMLIVNNQKGTALVADFDQALFVSSTLGDQALEGFAPNVVKTDGNGAATERLFLGVTLDGKELVVYCSGQATVGEASAALSLAGVPVERQLEADGGGSAACGYNLPGQFFVEPERTLPLLMGASTIVARGTVSTDGLNVRSGPATTHAIVAKLAKTTPILIFEEKTGWLRIGTGQWVSKPLVKLIK